MYTHGKTKPITRIDWLGPDGLAEYLAALWGHHDFTWNDAGNDTYHRVRVDPGDRFDEYDRAVYARAKVNGYIEDYQIHALFLGLVADGDLPPGDYLVNVSW